MANPIAEKLANQLRPTMNTGTWLNCYLGLTEKEVFDEVLDIFFHEGHVSVTEDKIVSVVGLNWKRFMNALRLATTQVKANKFEMKTKLRWGVIEDRKKRSR